MTPTYPLEELLKVREKMRDTVEVVRRISNSECGEHILRSSAGFDSRRNRLRASSIVTNPYEELISDDFRFHANKSRSKSGRYSRYSPTPSIKRGKAEKLLKEHGSPPGVRVTAGGRIVPDSLSPIASPLFDGCVSFKHDYSNPLNCGFGYNANSTTMPKHLNGYVVDIGNGMLCQFVDGELRAVENQNGVLQLHMPAPNLPVHSGIVPIGAFAGSQAFLPFVPQSGAQIGLRTDVSPMTSGTGGPLNHLPTEREIKVMEQVHSKLEHELKDLDRHEVLQRALLNQAKRVEIVRARVALVNRIDTSRRAIENVKKMMESGSKFVSHGMGAIKTPSTHVPVQRSTPNVETQYMCDQRPVNVSSYDENLHVGSQLNFTGHGFQPNVPEFIPHQYIVAEQGKTHKSPALRERAFNIGFGVRMDLEGSCSSAETAKAYDLKHDSSSMNLDGSAHQIRRSHAIEIKKPGNDSAREKSYLNPASPSYRPSKTMSGNSQDSDGQGEVLSFIPSPSLVAQMDSLVQSPGSQDRELGDFPVERHQSSDSSATTADFFPQDAYQHSSRKSWPVKRDIQVNLPAWMPKHSEIDRIESQATPPKPTNRFVFNDDSPTQMYFPNLPASGESHSGSLRYGTRHAPDYTYEIDDTDKCASRTHDAPAECNAAPSIHSRSLPNVISVSRLVGKVNEQDLPRANMNTLKTDAYLQGFQIGIRQDILADGKDEAYRVGYRDGLLQSSFAPSSAPILRNHARGEHGSPSAKYELKVKAPGVNIISSIAKATSFPSFGGTAVSVPPVPIPPTNSLATTPTRHWSTKQERSPITEAPLDSPTARADFMSQPNINVSSMHSRSIVGNISRSTTRAPDSTSPLANRSASNQTSDMGTSKQSSFAARMKNRQGGYDKQRYQKCATSVAQTNDNACAQFPSQYDGSADDEDLVDNDPTSVQSPATPSTKGKAKAKMSGSPVRIRASQAVATMRQAAGMASKKEEDAMREASSLSRKGSKKHKEADPALMSSPEKRRWRETWAKSFRQLRKEEQEEIEKYKHEHSTR